MDLYDITVPQFSKMLHNVELWLDAGIAYAKAKKFEPDQLDRCEERLFDLRAMARKLGVSVEELPTTRVRFAEARSEHIFLRQVIEHARSGVELRERTREIAERDAERAEGAERRHF